MPDTPDFEWITAQIRDEDGDKCTRHYLVDPSGQVRGDVDEPVGGRLSYIADLYWSDGVKYSNWISLSLAKAHVEQSYLDLLAKRIPKNEINQVAGPEIPSCAEVAALAAGAAPAAGVVETPPIPAVPDETGAGAEATGRGEAGEGRQDDRIPVE